MRSLKKRKALIPKYEKITLENGFEVYFAPVNEKSGVISVDLYYKVGSRDETLGKTGIAHMLEHMNFKSTKKHKAGEFDRIVKSFGGVDNASTGFDFTHYYITIPSEYFDKAMELHSDMLLNQIEMIELENIAKNEEAGTREVPFGREVYIERDDFMEEPVPKYRRFFPGNEVRLKGAYFVKCTDVIKDENGNVVEIHGTYDPETKSGSGFTGRKVKGTVHWVEASTAVPCEFRLFEPLILDDAPENEGKHFLDQINPNSLNILEGFVEPTAIKDAKPLDKFQFVRNGFFSVDTKYTTPEKLVFNRIVPLKSSFKLKK